MTNLNGTIMEIYASLLNHYGPRGWWPGESHFEIIVGAILTQAVSWKNVEKAIAALKKADLFTMDKILALPQEELADIIRPTLYHRQKAKKLAVIMGFIKTKYQGNIQAMFLEPQPKLRKELLSLWGIGEETADSILLYAGDYPIFVVDNYTRRIFARLGIVDENISYHEMQKFMEQHVANDTEIYNEYHALLVALGASACTKNKPHCMICPLEHFCKYYCSMQELL